MSRHTWNHPSSDFGAKCIICGLIRSASYRHKGKIVWVYGRPNEVYLLKKPNCMGLTKAQKREFLNLKKHGSVYVYGHQRRGVFQKLKDMNICTSDGYWFHINEKYK